MEAALVVGFAASLVTLSAVVGDSARTVHTLWSNFRNSPTNLKRLSHAIAENEALLKDMQAVSDAYEQVGIPESLLSRWSSTYNNVCNDFRELNLEMSKILECTKGSEITSKHVRRRIRHFFSEKVLELRYQQLSMHKADMSYIHLLMHSSYTIQIGEKLQSFGQTIDKAQQESLSKLEEVQDSLQTTQTELVQAVQAELRRFSNPRAIAQAFNIVTDRPVATRRSSPLSVKDPEFPLHCSRIIPSQGPCPHPSGGLVYAVEWRSHKYRFALGTLQVEHVESIDVEVNEREAASVQLVSCRSKRIRFTFKPPTWFSNLIMKIDVAMQISRHGCIPAITWGPVPSGRQLEPLIDELYQISNLRLDQRLLAIARIGELDYLFEDVISYCLGIVPSSNGKISQTQRDARPIADALEQGHISIPGGEVGSRFLTKIIVRIEGIKSNKASGSAQSRRDMPQSLSRVGVLESDDILLDRVHCYLSEIQRAIWLSSNLVGAGAQLPASIDFASILMSDHGLWYLQNVCPTFDITEIGTLSPPSQWIFACLVRTMSACYESVSRQLQGFPMYALQFYVSAERLTNEINSSPESLRHRFLLSLSVGGSTSMLDALLFHGLSLGDLSTYYFEKAIERGRFTMAHLLLKYGASLSLETSTRLLVQLKHDMKTPLLNPRMSEAFCLFLERLLRPFRPLQELDGEHPVFESLVRIFQRALLESRSKFIKYSESNGDDQSPNRVVRLLLEAGLFRDSKLPALYWSLNLLFLTSDNIDESPLTLAISVRNVYAVRLLIKYGYDVNEVHPGIRTEGCGCIEHKGTPVTYAIWLGFNEVVSVLLEAGADVTKQGLQSQTALEMAKICVSIPGARGTIGYAKDIDLKDFKDDTGSRERIFAMVCADLKTKRGTKYEDYEYIFRSSCLRFADHHPPSPRYWKRRVKRRTYCPVAMMGPPFDFTWNGFQRYTWRCPCLDCWSRRSSSESSHSPLPEPWERLFAPCKCSFIKGSTCGLEGTFVGSDGGRWEKYCPSGDERVCNVRILYINHITGESTLRCPCATCCPDRKGVPCLTLASLFGEDEPVLSKEATSDDPLIPVQDLTRVGKPCWRLGNLFDEHTLEDPDLDDDPVIPAQDVGLDIFDDMPGFALARNHLDPTKRQPSPALRKRDSPTVSTPKDSPSYVDIGKPRRGDWTIKHLLSLLTTTTTRFSKSSFHALLPSSSYPLITTTTTATTTPSTLPMDNHGPRRFSEAFAGFILSTLLVVVYECIDIYIYIKTLPPPPRFLCRLVGGLGAVLVVGVVGVWALSRG